MTFACQQVSVSSMKAIWPFHTKPALHLERSEKGEEIARGRKIFHLRLWTPYQWWLHSDTWFLITWFLQRYSANRGAFTFQKEKNCFHFTLPVPPPHTHSPPLKVTFISESVFLRVYLKVGLSRVMSHQHMFGTISGKVLGNHRKAVTQIGGFYINEHWFKQFWGRDSRRGMSTHFPLPGLHSFKCYFLQHDMI